MEFVGTKANIAQNVYSIRDEKTGFVNVFLEQTDEAAKRGFSFSVLNSKSIMGFAPADFSLYRVGSYDLDTGVLSPVSPLVLLCTGGECVNADTLKE